MKISCGKFDDVADTGGSCPADTDNLLALVQALRSGLGEDAIISIASQAARALSDDMNIKAVSQYVGRKSPLATKNLLEVTDGLRRPTPLRRGDDAIHQRPLDVAALCFLLTCSSSDDVIAF